MTYVVKSSGGIGDLGRRAHRRSRSLVKRVAQPLFNPQRESRAAFLVGCGRSGTDLLAVKLGQAFDCQLINEDNPLGFRNWRLRDVPTLRTLVDRSFARVVLFKPIVETYRINELLAAFDDSRALFASRGYGDAINSMVDFFGEATRRVVDQWLESGFASVAAWPIAEETRLRAAEMYANSQTLQDVAAIYWYVYNRAFFTLQLDSDARVQLVLYEDVVTRPQRELAQAAAHIGLRFRTADTVDIFSSVGRRRPPQLHPLIEAHCAELWRALRAARAGEDHRLASVA